ncbi:RHS repeat-associated core domain-containing protein, partial [Boseongicola sp. H5]|uniref:PKD domain-containing protein n=1 Tax=Boseongicola sp. H5 TaxID=2763261 RepID=UPI001D0B3D27
MRLFCYTILFSILTPLVALADNLTSLGLRGDGTTMWRLQSDASTSQQVTLRRYGGGFETVFTVDPGRTIVAGAGAGTYIAEFSGSGERITKASGPQPFDACFHFGDCEPVATCGAPTLAVAALIGQTVRLDPLPLLDVATPDRLAVSWRWSDRPATSVAGFSEATALRPNVTIDVAGTYVALADIRNADEGPDAPILQTVEIQVGTGNIAPVAMISGLGTPRDLRTLVLDGSGSTDINGDSLSYSWSVESRPVGSVAELSNVDAASVSFAFDETGDYAFGLVVEDDSGLRSSLACFSASFVAADEAPLVYATSFDRTFENDGSPQVEFDLGDVSADATTNRLIESFDVNGGGESSFDTVRFVFRGNSYSLSSRGDFLDFVSFIEFDGDGTTDAQVSPDPNVRDLTFVFDEAGSAVTLRNVIGNDLRRDALLNRSADFYEARPERSVAPVAALRFEDRRAAIGETVAFDPYDSTDIDGNPLSSVIRIVAGPAGSLATMTTTADGIASFAPDVAGDYLVRLVVDDGENASTDYALVVVEGTENLTPVARVARPSLATLGQPLVLDATQSYDLDGDLLTYNWAIITQPVASIAELSSTKGSVERFTPDVDGLYIAQLTVSDGIDTSQAITLAIDTTDPRPVALAGTDILRPSDQDVALDGQAIAGPGVVFDWALTGLTESAPNIQASGLGDAAAVLSFGTPDAGGVAQLVVSGAGRVSYPDTVFIGAGNQRPRLTPQPVLTASVGVDVVLNAAQIASDPNNDALAYTWSLIARPPGSSALLAEAQVPGTQLSFTPDRTGLFLLQLTGSDGSLDAEPVILALDVVNSAPVAVVPPALTGFVGDTVVLDGTGSFDPDGNQLFFDWSIVSRPAASTVDLAQPNTMAPEFVPDVRGDYVFSLTVSDGLAVSAPASLTLSTPNRRPQADIAGPSEATVGETIAISAAASTDPDNDLLEFIFQVTAAPVGSTADVVADGLGRVLFTPDRQGVFEVSVTVSDGDETASTVLQITATAENAAPVLADILPLYTVALGLEFALDLVAADPDGDPLGFFAGPLPLPEGVGIDANSGAIRFRPEDGQVGTYVLNVGVSDGRLTDTATLTIEVVPADAGETAVMGRVLDAVDFANGVDTPLAGIPVRLRDAALIGVTQADGTFRFGGLTAGTDQVFVEPSADGGPGGYLSTTRVIRITENQERDLAPDFLLAPLNDGCTTVVAGAETVLSGVASGVTVRIPADTIRDQTGALYSGDVCLGTLPELFETEGFPDGTQACRIYSLDATGANFTAGFTVSAPNVDLLPEATELGLWRRSPINGQFLQTAAAGVDLGASTVSGVVPRLTGGAQFTFLPQPPITMASTDQTNGNRMATPLNGNLEEIYVLPSYRAFDQDQQIALSYHSRAADPTVIVAGDVTITSTSSLPVSLSTRLEIGGLSIADTAEWTPRIRSDGYTPALVGEEVSIRQSAVFDATGYDSGNYAYDFVAEARYACSTVASSHAADLHVQNRTDSPYGRGWSIDGLQQLVQAPDGTVSIVDDDEIVVFDPEPTITQFTEEPLEFPARGVQTVLARDYDGDGDLDVSFGDSGTGSIGFITNFGNRDLRLAEPFVVANPNEVTTGQYTPNLASTAAGDLSNNGNLDIAYVLQLQDGYGFLSNNGFGEFSNQLLGISTADVSINDVTVADMDNDGFDDIVFISASGSGFIARDEVYISYGGPSGRSLVRVVNRSFGDRPLQVIVADIDNDGRKDVAFRTREEGVHIAFATGARSYAFVRTALGANPPVFLGDFFDLIDVNQDGLLDVVWSGESAVQLFVNDSGRAFQPAVNLPRPGNFTRYFLFVEDINRDGIEDVLLSAGREIAVLPGNGSGGFAPFEFGDVPYSATYIDLADVDGDGSLDLVSSGTFVVRVHFSQPSATGNFIPRDGEFSQLSRLPDGGWERRYTDGTVVLFDSAGFQTAEIDTQGNRRDFAYGTNGELLTITDQIGGVTEMVYDENLRLALIRYPDGRETSFEYEDQTGDLLGITEPEGGTVSFSYDDQGRLVSTTNQNGNTSTYTFDAVGNMTGGTMPDGSTIAAQVASSLGLVNGLGGVPPQPFVYVAPEDRVTTLTDRNGEVSEVIVNEFGSIIQITDPLGRITRLIRNDQNLVVRIERPLGSVASGSGATAGADRARQLAPTALVRIDELEYDALGNVTRITEAVGTPQERTMRYEYEPEFSNVTRRVDADGFETRYEYDGDGEVTAIFDPEGGVRRFTYTATGLLASRTDENGNVTLFDYDDRENLTLITYADGSITQMTYDTAGNITTIAEAVGTPIERRIQRSFDLMNRVLSVEVTGADGVQIDGITTYTYDAVGNLATITDETGLVTTMTYDPLERLVAVDDPAEGLIQRTYNLAGEITQHISGDGAIHTYDYDAVSRLIETVDPEGFIKTFAHDDRDNILSVTDGRAGTTNFAYDPLDRMTTRTDPLGLTIARAYDDRGNLVTLTREDGLIETATYDGLSRRTQVVTPDNTLTYGYDPRGNLTLAADNDSRVTFTYDARNRVATTTTDGTVGPQPAVTLTYTYDALDRRIGLTDSLGGTYAYAYDVEDRLTQLTSPWGSTYDFGYDGEGRRTSLTASTGRSSTMSYQNGLLATLTHVQSGVTLTDLAYDYAPDGQLEQIVDARDPARSLTLAYDDLNRVILVSEGVPADQGGVPIPIEDYAYDAEGNRLASHLSGLYDTNPHNQLLSDDTYTYAYDARGNRISRTDRATGAVETYSYDSQNRLIGWTDGVSVISYAHDALDRRIAVTLDGVTESFVYDPWSPYSAIANDVLLDFEDGALVRRWLHGPEVDEPLAYERYAGTTAGGSGTALELFRNRLGSVILAVSVSTGAVAAEYDYDSFGQRTLVQGTEEARYGFTAREHDARTGLIHYRARAYDPLTGQFLQRDPIGFASGDLNLYAYVENDPYNFTDPSGLTALDGAATIGRSAGMSTGLSGLFGGVLNLANAIRASLVSAAAIGTGVAM